MRATGFVSVSALGRGASVAGGVSRDGNVAGATVATGGAAEAGVCSAGVSVRAGVATTAVGAGMLAAIAEGVGATTVEGSAVTKDAVKKIGREEVERLDAPGRRFADALALFEDVALADRFVEFLTLPGYDRLP